MTSSARLAGLDWLRLIVDLLVSCVLGTLIAGFAGAAAHSVAAACSIDLYSLAIGDHLLPPSPVDSYFWGPILIGFFVTWWVGISFAPVIHGVCFLGRRARWATIGWALLAAYALGAVVVAFFTRAEMIRGGAAGDSVAVAVITRGYWALFTVLLAFAGLVWIGKRRQK